MSYAGDLKKLKIHSFKHRHKFNSKPYICNSILLIKLTHHIEFAHFFKYKKAQYRRKEIKEALIAPLIGNEEVRDQESRDKIIQNNFKKKEHLICICQVNKITGNKINFTEDHIRAYMTQEKLGILGMVNYKSNRFNSFLRDEFLSNELKGKYLLGLNASTCDWLLDMFYHVAQTHNIFKMVKYIYKILNKLK
jgi:hypothetical protein